MRAVTWHGVGDIRVDTVPDPEIRDPRDAVIKITTSAICGTDLHFVRGTMPGMKPGVVLGHEAVGEVVASGERGPAVGTRVVVASTIACGACRYCQAGLFAQCDTANPGGPHAGTAFFGGPEAAGGFDGLQAEYARIPYADVGLVEVPDGVGDEQAVLVSDIFPTGWFGARLADVGPGDSVAVLGCGPVGLLAIASARLQGAERVFAVDHLDDRLDQARAQGAETVNFDLADPVEALRELTNGVGPAKVIDAVGVDAVRPHQGPAAPQADELRGAFQQELRQATEKPNPVAGTWVPGDAPSQALRWAVEAVAKAGTVAIIGVYPPGMTSFPIGTAMNRNLTVRGGNCHHRRYIPRLLDLIASGRVDPAQVLSHHEPMTDALNAYAEFDRRDPGWIKVAISPDQ